MFNRTQNIFILVLFTVIIILFSTETNAQSSLNYRWYINANVGLSQLFGDVQNENNHFSKLQDETDLGYGVRLGRYVSPVFGVHFQFLYANFKGQKDANDIKFTANVMEYQLGTTINLLNLFSENKERRVNLYLLTGVGALMYRSEARRISSDLLVNDYNFLVKVAWIPFLVIAGKIALVADPFQLFAEHGFTISILPVVGPFLGDVSHPDTGAHAGRGIPAALFVSPVDDDKIPFQLYTGVVDAPHHFQGGQHTENAVEAAAGPLSVEMRPGHDGPQIPILSGADGEHIAHFINDQFTAGFLHPLGVEVAHFLVFIGGGASLNALVVGSADFCRNLNSFLETCTVDTQVLQLIGPVFNFHKSSFFT